MTTATGDHFDMRTGDMALLEVKPPHSLEEWTQAMDDLRAKVHEAPGSPKCHATGWDFKLRRA